MPRCPKSGLSGWLRLPPFTFRNAVSRAGVSVIIILFIIIGGVGAYVLYPSFSPSSSTTSGATVGPTTSTTVSTSSTTTASTYPHTTTSATPVTSSTTSNPQPPSLLLEAEGQVGSISANGGSIYYPVGFSSSSCGFFGCSPASIAIKQGSPFSYLQDVEVRVRYQPLQKVVFDSLGKVSQVQASGQGEVATVLLVNSSMPSYVPLSWNVKLGDLVIVDVYSDTTTPLIYLQNIGINNSTNGVCHGGGACADVRTGGGQSGESPPQCFTITGFSPNGCVFPAGQQLDVNLTLSYNSYQAPFSVVVAKISTNSPGFSIVSTRPALPINVTSSYVVQQWVLVTMNSPQVELTGDLDIIVS